MIHHNDSTIDSPAFAIEGQPAAEATCLLTLLFHPDPRRIGQRAQLPTLGCSQQAPTSACELSRLSPLFYSPEKEYQGLDGECLDDPHLSRQPLTLTMRSQQLVISGAKSAQSVLVNGKPYVEGEPISYQALQQGVVITLANRIVLLLQVAELNRYRPKSMHGLIGFSDNIQYVRQLIDKVAELSVPVLIRGESGSGKELIAAAIHQASLRANQAMVSVNMAAIPPSLAASSLYGSKKGAFTGSVKDQQGYFEQAHEGTLFLDEIGDAPEEVQLSLLRALETGEIQAIGCSKSRVVDIRLLSATDANLESKIQDQSFRNPLLQRLSGFEITMAPLCERRDDIARLMLHFLQQELALTDELERFNPAFIDAVAWAKIFERFHLYHWPGNIRQLKNTLRQLVISIRGDSQICLPLKIESLFESSSHKEELLTVQNQDDVNPSSPTIKHHSSGHPATTIPRRKPSDLNLEELFKTMQSHQWDIKSSAQKLGVSRSSLYTLIDKHPVLRRACDIGEDEIKESYLQCQGDLVQMSDALMLSLSALKRRVNELKLNG